MSLQQLPNELVYVICQYLSLEDILHLKECIPVEQCGILFNFLLPHRQNLETAVRIFNEKYKHFKAVLNKQGWMFDIDVMLLIWKFKEVQYHQAHYQNLLHKMKLGKWVRLKTMQCLGCKLKFRKPQTFLCHLNLIFPSCNPTITVK